MRISRVDAFAWSLILVGALGGAIFAPLAAARVGAVEVEASVVERGAEAGVGRGASLTLRYRLEGHTYESQLESRNDAEVGARRRVWGHPRRPGELMEGSPLVLLLGTLGGVLTSTFGLGVLLWRHQRKRRRAPHRSAGHAGEPAATQGPEHPA